MSDKPHGDAALTIFEDVYARVIFWVAAAALIFWILSLRA